MRDSEDGNNDESDNDDDDGDTTALKNYKAKESAFLKYFGHYDWRSGTISIPRNEGDPGEKVLKKDAAQALLDFKMQVKPPVPQPGKWLKMFPTLLFLMLNWMPGTAFVDAFVLAYQRDMTGAAQVASSTDMADTDRQLYEELSFTAVAGERVKASSKFLHDDEPQLFCFSI